MNVPCARCGYPTEDRLIPDGMPMCSICKATPLGAMPHIYPPISHPQELACARFWSGLEPWMQFTTEAEYRRRR